jgi:ABC-2 type transport system ATP-binding protein
MWDYLRELNAEGTTIILTTHYLEEAESLCRNIAIIDKGASRRRRYRHAARRAAHRDLRAQSQGPRRRAAGARRLRARAYRRQHAGGGSAREHSINGLFEALSRNGIEVVSMRNKQNRLERLFLDLVDRRRGPAATRRHPRA